jgi:hypothetical protein
MQQCKRGDSNRADIGELPIIKGAVDKLKITCQQIELNCSSHISVHQNCEPMHLIHVNSNATISMLMLQSRASAATLST